MKLGGSVITHKELTPPQIHEENLTRIAKEIGTHTGRMIVVLGGGSHGHQAAHKFGYGDSRTSQKQLLSGIAHIRHNMTLLSLEVETSFNESGLASVVISPFSSSKLDNGRIITFPLEFISLALQAGIIPILHGDVCFDITRGASILSGDTIVTYLAENFRASHVFIGTDVDGIYTSNPQNDPNASLIPEIDDSNINLVLQRVGPSSSTDVTGGMQKKLTELLALTKQHQSEVAIFNLCVPGRLQSLLAQQSIPCTRIRRLRT